MNASLHRLRGSSSSSYGEQRRCLRRPRYAQRLRLAALPLAGLQARAEPRDDDGAGRRGCDVGGRMGFLGVPDGGGLIGGAEVGAGSGSRRIIEMALIAMASNLLVMASNLIGMASNP